MIVYGFVFFFFTELDTRSEACQRFFREGLTTSFTKVLTDEAVNGWKYDIHVSVDVGIFLAFEINQLCLLYMPSFLICFFRRI